jgi:hypothetical protein
MDGVGSVGSSGIVVRASKASRINTSQFTSSRSVFEDHVVVRLFDFIFLYTFPTSQLEVKCRCVAMSRHLSARIGKYC